MGQREETPFFQSGKFTDSDLVVVYGALRSGTTMLRLMLDSHPNISNPGEFDFVFDYLKFEADGTQIYDRAALSMDRIFADFEKSGRLPDGYEVDLQTLIAAIFSQENKPVRTFNIHRNLLKALEAFENLRVIRIIRHPMAVAESSKKMGWGGNLYSAVQHWIVTEAHWNCANLSIDRVCEVRFEELLNDPQAELERICRFLKVDYDPLMLSYPNSSTYRKPDKSRLEDRAPTRDWTLPYAEWRCHEQMIAAGYVPLSKPIKPSAFIRFVIALESKALNFTFSCKRYGVGLAIAHRVARRINFQKTTRYILGKMAEVDRRLIK